MRIICACLAVLFAAPLSAAAGEFDWMVREFSRETGAKPIRIPFFGLARFIVAVGQPAGASELRLAVFEHTKVESMRFTEIVDGAVGSAWQPMVRVQSRDGESTNIYAQRQGRNLRLLIASLDTSGDTTFVHLRVRPETLMKFLDEHCRNR